MSDFKAKMHQIRFRLGRCSLQRSPDYAGFKGPTSKEKEGREGRRGGDLAGFEGAYLEGEVRVGEGKEGEGIPLLKILNTPLLTGEFSLAGT